MTPYSYQIQAGRLVVFDHVGEWLFSVSQAAWPRVKAGVKDALIPFTDAEASEVAADHYARHMARAG